MSLRRMLPGLILSLLVVAVVLYRLDFEQLAISMRSVRVPLLVAAAFLPLIALLVRSWRWHFLLKPIKVIGAESLVTATAIGAMSDMLLPARAGDVIRAYLLGEREQISKLSALSTIVVEKVFDVGVIFLAAIGLVVYLGITRETAVLPGQFTAGLITVGPALVIAGIFFWILLARPEMAGRMIDALLSWLPDSLGERIGGWVESFLAGLRTVRVGSNLLPISLLTVLLWSIFAFNNYLILRAFGLNLPIYASVLILIFQILGVTLPSSPGFIGTYHAAVLVGLAIFGISQELALSVAIAMHAAFFGPFIVIGLLFVWWEGLSLQQLWSHENDEGERRRVLENSSTS